MIGVDVYWRARNRARIITADCYGRIDIHESDSTGAHERGDWLEFDF